MEKDETIKKINTKSLEELLKEIYSDNTIDIRKLAEIFLINKYNEKYSNIYDLLKEMIMSNTKLIISVEVFIERITSNEKYENEFKGYLLSSQKKDNLKEQPKQKSYTIVKNIKLNHINEIYSFMVINNIIAVLVDNCLNFYNTKTLELIVKLKFNLGNNIIKSKEGKIIGKVVEDNYAIFINPSNLKYKKNIFLILMENL